MQNPKLAGSNLIDAIPVGGICPNGCVPCFYNHGDLPTGLDSYLPTLEDVGDKIVRVNSGKDSTVDFNDVIKLTRKYPKKFYNTSLPTRICEFPAPVVFTAIPNNIQWFTALSEPFKLMAVRLRVCSWNIKTVDSAVRHYAGMNVPIILTFLYWSESEEWNSFFNDNQDYELKKHITGNRFMIKEKEWSRIVGRYTHYPQVFTCGSYNNHLCKDCGNCERLYKRAMSMYF